MSQRIEKEIGPITFVPNRDWKLIFLIASIFFIVLIVFFAPEETTQETRDLMQGLVFAVIGIYGGIRGRGESKSDKPDAVDNENNTLGVKPGIARGVAAIFLLCLIAFAFVADMHDELPFLVLSFTELFGISIPPIAKSET